MTPAAPGPTTGSGLEVRPGAADDAAADRADGTAPAVALHEIEKRYGAVTALRGLSLTAERGTITALLGPNGAGKTTTVEICEGFRHADAGTVRVLGLDPVRDHRALRPRVGVMLQSGGIPQAAPPKEFLALLAAFHAHPLDPAVLLDRLGVADCARRPFRRLSTGQRQRVALAAAVVGRPELVFLDEPTAGLDPQARRAAWDLIAELRDAGVTVILTTHHMDEAEHLADEVVIIDGGAVVTRGAPGALAGETRRLRFRADAGLALDELRAALPEGCTAEESPAGHYVVGGDIGPAVLATVSSWCAAHGVHTGDLRIERRTLEDVFLELTGRDLRG